MSIDRERAQEHGRQAGWSVTLLVVWAALVYAAYVIGYIR